MRPATAWRDQRQPTSARAFERDTGPAIARTQPAPDQHFKRHHFRRRRRIVRPRSARPRAGLSASVARPAAGNSGFLDGQPPRPSRVSVRSMRPEARVDVEEPDQHREHAQYITTGLRRARCRACAPRPPSPAAGSASPPPRIRSTARTPRCACGMPPRSTPRNVTCRRHELRPTQVLERRHRSGLADQVVPGARGTQPSSAGPSDRVVGVARCAPAPRGTAAARRGSDR